MCLYTLKKTKTISTKKSLVFDMCNYFREYFKSCILICLIGNYGVCVIGQVNHFFLNYGKFFFLLVFVAMR